MRESQRLEDEVLAGGEPVSARVPDTLHGARLDAAAAALFPDFSRSRLAEWIKAAWDRIALFATKRATGIYLT